MKGTIAARRRGLATLGAMFVAACAGYGGSGLTPGLSNRSEVLAAMGTPAMVWKHPDGSEQLAYPRGPAGTQTYMAWLGPDGRLQRIEKTLEDAQFSRIGHGMHMDEVLRILGPPGEPWVEFYSRRNEIAWSWLYCSSTNHEEFFDVMFDAGTGIVRSTGRHPHLVGWDGIQPWCAH